MCMVIHSLAVVHSQYRHGNYHNTGCYFPACRAKDTVPTPLYIHSHLFVITLNAANGCTAIG